ncbi:hypothetical protein AB1N83_005144 [Pleurotus pulmonarius]
MRNVPSINLDDDDASCQHGHPDSTRPNTPQNLKCTNRLRTPPERWRVKKSNKSMNGRFIPGAGEIDGYMGGQRINASHEGRLEVGARKCEEQGILRNPEGVGVRYRLHVFRRAK